MTTEPTSALSYNDLILEVAIKLGVASYGTNGTEKAQVPVDAHDLDECQRHVNNGIRMLISHAPLHGWRWTRQIATVTLWASGSGTASGTNPGGQGTITATTEVFYPSMVGHDLDFTVSEASYTITEYVSSTVVRVSSDPSSETAVAFTITADGNYTLPRTFGGQYTGDPTFVAGSNESTNLEWTSSIEIRRRREISTTLSSTPRLLAIRRVTDLARRWELVAWPTPSSTVTVEFPFELYFDTLVYGTDMHPAGYKFDEVVKAACFAAMERDAEDMHAGLMDEYLKIALPSAYQADGRSAPPKLGVRGHRGSRSLREFRHSFEQPNVTFTL